MKPWRLIAGLAGLILFLVAAWQIRSSQAGLETHRSTSGPFPVTFIGQEGSLDGSRPLVLIGHGFSGSGTIMNGFALTLAHAGYTTALWDFDGHGSNPNPMAPGFQIDSNLANVEFVKSEARRIGLADLSRTAVLGHSMGSGVALLYGQTYPDTWATIAVSPIGITVSPDLPHNLLLMAGELEPNFIMNAERRLAEAGGDGGDPAEGTARALVIIPGVEHMSIIFSSSAHRTALDWLDRVFGLQPGARLYSDRRILWFVLGVAGSLLAALFLSPTSREAEPSETDYRPLWYKVLSLVGGMLLAVIFLWGSGLAGLQLEGLLGLRIGGYLLVWFGLSGLFSLILLRLSLPRPNSGQILAGLLIFVIMWVGVGLMSHLVWLPWLLIPQRLVLWPAAVMLLLPWFLAFGEAQRRTGPAGRAAWWLFQSITVFAVLYLGLRLTPSLGFLLLILPVVPALFLLHAVPVLDQRSRWSIALSGSLFIGWMLLAVFPLA
jgi:pimeloyl-ACP methyl ester carboxylesterase